MATNGDTERIFRVGTDDVRGLGSFHKTLPHREPYGEVDTNAFETLVKATGGNEAFANVPKGTADAAALVNPQAGLAHDHLSRHPVAFDMPPAPTLRSLTTAAEMTELYWMAVLRDLSLDGFAAKDGVQAEDGVQTAASEISEKFALAVADIHDLGHLRPGVDVPGSATTLSTITRQNIFRLGLPGEEVGPMVSQFFIRDVNFGTQTINQKQRPYKRDANYLTNFSQWLHAQNSGNGDDGKAYSDANVAKEGYYEAESCSRYIATMRDLARFVNKDALHQAYFNATLLLLSGKANWTPGNPYNTTLKSREAGFGTLGGPHILALVSEVATRALKIVWNQKWQVNLRLRPEAYGGLVHVQEIGLDPDGRRPYELPEWVATTLGAKSVRELNNKHGNDTLLLPMAFTSGSPAHPAYGAGHATVAGACVTVLKAFFKTYDITATGEVTPLSIKTLEEKTYPYAKATQFATYITGVDSKDCAGYRTEIDGADMTIEGELNKLASNVAMGRSMGGVHWRTDNTRSLMLGEAISAQILADITMDLVERPKFEFRSFSRKEDGNPKMVKIEQGRIMVDGVLVDSHISAI